jgi:hypothetical protein
VKRILIFSWFVVAHIRLETTAPHVLFWEEKKPARIEPGLTYLSDFAVYTSISIFDPR